MDNSPKSLSEIIKIENSNLSELNIVKYNENYYITESSLNSFMEYNNLSDENALINEIKTSGNINEIHLLNELELNEDLLLINDIMSLYESLNPIELEIQSKGDGIFKNAFSKLKTIIFKQKYTKESEINSKIEKCNKTLKSIKEEKEKIKKSKSHTNIKFSAVFLFKILKDLFNIFIIPKIVDILYLPKIVKFIFGSFGNKKLQGAMDIISVLSTIPESVRNLYLSFKDYDTLLSDYEDKISAIKEDLEYKKKKLSTDKGENDTMEKNNIFTETCSLDEIEAPASGTKVFYQKPEELGSDEHRDVVHDDNTNVDFKGLEIPNPINNSFEPPIHQDTPITSPMAKDPLDAIMKAKLDPRNIPIAKYRDNYYIDLNDLKCYMDACGESKFENALNNIIDTHEDADISANNIRVVTTKNHINDLNEETIENMESSEVQFEIY